jgi:hypothetical protein
VADAFRKQADRVAAGERLLNRHEGLDVSRCIDALIEPPIDRNRAGPIQNRRKSAVEQRRLGEEADVPGRGGPDYGRIEQRVGMVREEQHGAGRRDQARRVHAVEHRRDRARERADERKRVSRGHPVSAELANLRSVPVDRMDEPTADNTKATKPTMPTKNSKYLGFVSIVPFVIFVLSAVARD